MKPQVYEKIGTFVFGKKAVEAFNPNFRVICAKKSKDKFATPIDASKRQLVPAAILISLCDS